MIRSGSQSAINDPDNEYNINTSMSTTGQIVCNATVKGVGGIYVAIDSFSEDGTTAGGIRMGAIGVQYATADEAKADACKLALAMAEKNRSSRLGFGGCKTVIYVLDKENLTAPPGVEGSPRAQLFKALAVVLGNYLDKLLVGPDMFTARGDLKYLRERCLELYPKMKHCPVPARMMADEDVISISTAWSTFGALEALALEKKWKAPKAAIQGLGNVGGETYKHLVAQGWDVVAYDPMPERMAMVPLDKQREDHAILFEECDILIPCARGGVLNIESVPRLKCKCVAGAANCQIFPEVEQEVHKLLEERGIEYYSEAMINVGGVSFAVHSFTDTLFTYEDSRELGASNMRLMMHERHVVDSYHEDEKRAFYDEVMGAPDNISFGLWKDIDIEISDAPTRAQIAMTNWMWNQAMDLSPELPGTSINYIDLGAGRGGAARHVVTSNKNVTCTCLNLNRNENREARERADAQGLEDKIEIVDGTYDRLPDKMTWQFDGCISQDAFVHAYSKEQAMREALRVTKGGGFMVTSDLFKGEGPFVSAEEFKTFASFYMVNDWQTPAQSVETAVRAGWTDVRYTDFTDEIRVSFQKLLKRVTTVVQSGKYSGTNYDQLLAYRNNLSRRLFQIDEGVFKYGAMILRKPYEVMFLVEPPFAPMKREMIKCTTCLEPDVAAVRMGTDAVVVTIHNKLMADDIAQLPLSVRSVISLSAGLDHIDQIAAKERGILVQQAGRDAIVSSVADFLLATTIFSLRDAFNQMGVRFPEYDWNLSWNAEGVDLCDATIGIVGMGKIAIALCERLRKLTHCRIIYTHDPEKRRGADESRLYLEYASLDTVLKESDVVLPMCSLTSETGGLIGYNEIAKMKKTACLINAARGKIVDTDGLTQALKEGLIRHAFLDTTDPEPLPRGHPLLSLKNVTITPHYATNTSFVRKQLVEDVGKLVMTAFDHKAMGLEDEEKRLRKDLSVAHIITRKYGMDELVWNHCSARLSDGAMLITPGALLFDEVRPEDICRATDNLTADIIHSAVYKARPDIKAIVHLHTPAAVAVSCLDQGFMCLAQESAFFHGKVANYAWQGISDDVGEGPALEASVTQEGLGDCNTLLMRNHGFCTFGRTVAEAWVLAYYFDKSCATQLKVLSSGAKPRLPDPAVLAHAAKQSFLPEFTPGVQEWAALERLAARRPC
mmetsp:Transcript_24056/g.57321  ORF Transcript_24056/g.57321 Transcript_24056/m.57321 type:complete len:1177 (-) Transcript_24056:238-3768(-)